MAFLVSPGVEVKEIDLTGIVPAVSTSIGAYAGHFDWGPIGDVVNLGNEKELARYFGSPSKSRAQSYFTASTFLRYGNTLLVSRAIDDAKIDEGNSYKTNALNASSGNAEGTQETISIDGFENPNTAPVLIKNLKEYETAREGYYAANIYARYPGSYGNSIKVMIQPADTPVRFNVTQLKVISSDDTASGLAVQITVDDSQNHLEDGLRISIRGVRSREDWINDIENMSSGFYLGDETPDANSSIKTFTLYKTYDVNYSAGTAYDPDEKYPIGFSGNKTPVPGSASATVVCPKVTDGFMYAPAEVEDFESTFVSKPSTSVYAEQYGVSNDEINILVIDNEGMFSDSPGTILERYANVSVASDAKKEDGSTNYYKDIINTSSKYIIIDNLTGIIDGDGDVIADVYKTDPNYSFASSYPQGGSIWQMDLKGGTNGDRLNGNVFEALELFSDPELIDVNLLFAENDSDGNITIANKLIRIAERRKDCVVFISPDLEVKDQSTEDAKLDKVIQKFDRLPSSNYAVFDSTPLYVYDKYHDEYIWIPACGTVAGLCARTDDVRDPWWSPAGYNRGQLLGVAKLAYNPLQNHRDELYKSRVNPIVAFPGEGIILFGDKTAQAKPSAFDRINVRRLFIVLEKAIATAAKYSLFEFNDEFTRAQFRNLVEPYLRDIQGRRGITDFLVVCDETNNTGEVIDSNRFVADIYIKPARSINFITLNFIATRTGVEFDEVVGKF